MERTVALLEYQAINSTFAKLEDEWVRVDFVDCDDKIMYCHNEDSGDEYGIPLNELMEYDTLEFYTLQRI